MKMFATVAGQTHEIEEGGLADLVAFERHFGIPASVMDPDDETPGRAEWLAFMIWRSLRKAGVIPKEDDFDTALDRIEDFEQVLEPGDPGYVPAEGEEVADVDPTTSPPNSELPAS